MKKKIGLSILGLCIPFLFWAQSEEINHQKYWWLRKRLKETFLHVGDKPGESLPGSRLYTNGKSRVLEFGDCTIHLGWYLAVLGTENFLLRMYGKDTKVNKDELYYALKAFERLDKNSNVLWSYWNGEDIMDDYTILANAQYDLSNETWIPKYPSIPTIPDGFFVREDIPPYFEQKLKGVDRIQGVSNFDNITSTYTTSGYKNGEESKDQLISMLMGLTFVYRFTDPTATVNGVNLRNYSKTLAERMVNYVRYQSNNQEYAWKITNPQRNYALVKRGNNPALLSYGIAWGANELIHDKSFSGNLIAQPWQDIVQPNYVDANAILFKSDFLLPRNVPVILDNNHSMHVNFYMYFVLASISNAWRDPWPVGLNGVAHLKKRCADSEEKGWLIYPMMNYALFPGKTQPYHLEYVESTLATYPCEGAYNFFVTNDPVHPFSWSPGWFSSNRFQASNGHYEGLPNVHANNSFNGRFNGLDYMLLYNLYRIIYVQQLQYHNYDSPTDLWLGHTYPVSPGGDGSMADPLRIYALNSIQSWSLANAVPGNANQTADVEYAAGERVILQPGFKVSNGARFKAYISQGGQCDNKGMKNAPLSSNGHPAVDRIVHWRDSLMASQLHADVETLREQNETVTPVADIQVYPNPFTDHVSVTGSLPYDQLLIVDSEGSKIWEQRTSTQPNTPYSIRMPKCAAGTYFLLMYQNGRFLGHNTLVKQ